MATQIEININSIEITERLSQAGPIIVGLMLCGTATVFLFAAASFFSASWGVATVMGISSLLVFAAGAFIFTQRGKTTRLHIDLTSGDISSIKKNRKILRNSMTQYSAIYVMNTEYGYHIKLCNRLGEEYSLIGSLSAENAEKIQQTLSERFKLRLVRM